MNDDVRLIRAAQAGDAGAFERLMERYYDTLYRFAYGWCGHAADAQDITQQACLRVAEGIGQFRFESAFSSWLYRLVINCAHDWSRRQRRHGGPDAAVVEEGADGSASVATRVYHWQLLEALEALPAALRETLLLVHLQGLSHAEAAAVLGVTARPVANPRIRCTMPRIPALPSPHAYRSTDALDESPGRHGGWSRRR